MVLSDVNVNVEMKLLMPCPLFKLFQLAGDPSRFEGRRTIQTKSMTGASRALSEGAARTRGKVSDTPVPPAVVRKFVTFGPKFKFDDKSGVPLGPQRIAAVVAVPFLPFPFWETSDALSHANLFQAASFSFAHLVM
jgi:hypothetical protein